MTELLVAALLTCATTPANCSITETPTVTHVHVCNISPGSDAALGPMVVERRGERYSLLLMATCTEV